MTLKAAAGKSRDTTDLVAALRERHIDVEVAADDGWPDDLEVVATSTADVEAGVRALGVLHDVLCPEEDLLAFRVEVESWPEDLLYHVPCRQWDAALRALPLDIAAHRPDRDGMRNWFRGRWMSSDEEWELTDRELTAETLTAARILEVLDPSEPRDWRDVQHFVNTRARCDELVEAMSAAVTPTQRQLLALVFHRRARPCAGAIPHLIGWLRDPDAAIREEAAESLGLVVKRIRNSNRRRRLGELAGAALLEYLQQFRDDRLYWPRLSLGYTGYEPARRYLERLVGDGSPTERESAALALESLDQAIRSFSK